MGNSETSGFWRGLGQRPNVPQSYSSFNASAASICASSSSVSGGRDSAATFSVICSARLAPISAEVTALSRSVHCSASWESVSPRAGGGLAERVNRRVQPRREHVRFQVARVVADAAVRRNAAD